MKQKGIEDLKQWSDEQQTIADDKKSEEEAQEEEEQGEIDLLGMDDTPAPTPEPPIQQQEDEPSKKNPFSLPPPPGMEKKNAPEVVGEPEIDLLGGGMEEIKPAQQNTGTENTDLFDLDLNLYPFSSNFTFLGGTLRELKTTMTISSLRLQRIKPI